MTKGEGSGWHRESRRHHDAAMKNGRDRGRAKVVQIARQEGFKKKAGKRPIVHVGAKFRQACRNTPINEMEPDLITGEPIPKQYTVAPMVAEEMANVRYKDYGDLTNYELDMVTLGFEDLYPNRPWPKNADQWRHFYNAHKSVVGVVKEPMDIDQETEQINKIERELGRPPL